MIIWLQPCQSSALCSFSVAKLTDQIQEKRVGPLPTKKIDGLNMPYVEMNMTDGTLCDLSGTPRSVRVLYICYRQGKHEVYSLEETRTCEYEVIILSPLLCAHPEYRVRDQLQNDINCYAEGLLPFFPSLFSKILGINKDSCGLFKNESSTELILLFARIKIVLHHFLGLELHE